MVQQCKCGLSHLILLIQGRDVGPVAAGCKAAKWSTSLRIRLELLRAPGTEGIKVVATESTQT